MIHNMGMRGLNCATVQQSNMAWCAGATATAANLDGIEIIALNIRLAVQLA